MSKSKNVSIGLSCTFTQFKKLGVEENLLHVYFTNDNFDMVNEGDYRFAKKLLKNETAALVQKHNDLIVRCGVAVEKNDKKAFEILQYQADGIWAEVEKNLVIINMVFTASIPA